MSDLETSKHMSRLLRSKWGRGARVRELDSSIGSASLVIYDAAKVTLTPASDGIIVDARSAIPSLAVFETSQTVQPENVNLVLTEIDASVRADLPSAFIHEFDAWVARGGETSSVPRPPRTPGPRVTQGEIEHHIANFWKTNLSNVSPSGGQASQTLARIYKKIDISFSTESAHGELIGGILLAEGIAVSAFGAWLSADHSDAAGLLRVCELIDHWARLRLDLALPNSDGAGTR